MIRRAAVRVLGVVHMAAGFHDLALVGLEIEVEMGERMVLDGAGAVAQGLELRQPVDGRRAPSGEVAGVNERPLQARVGQRVVDVVLEPRRGRRRGHRRPSVCGSPIAGPSAIPASTSATCRAFTGEFAR